MVRLDNPMKYFSSHLLLTLLLAASLAAETFVVTRTGDDNGPCEVDDCSLREAILAANALPGFDTILVPRGVYPIEIPGTIEQTDGGSFDLRDDVEIIGQAGTVIDGRGLDRVFYVGGCTGTLRNLVITGGATSEGGGGIWATLGEVRIIDTVVRENTALSGAGIGAGNAGILVDRSAILDNDAQVEGGGVYRIGLDYTDPVVVLDSTFSGNSARVGGGMRINNDATLEIRNSTIAHNSASIQGSAVSTRQIPPVTISNTLIVDSCAFSLLPNSEGGNIESPGTNCFLQHPTDRMGVPDAGLGALGLHGGPTPSYSLLPGSPALEGGENISCTDLDQRGFSRPQDGDFDGEAICDVGAYERLPGGGPVAIPALNRWGLGVFAILLMLWGCRRLFTGS